MLRKGHFKEVIIFVEALAEAGLFLCFPEQDMPQRFKEIIPDRYRIAQVLARGPETYKEVMYRVFNQAHIACKFIAVVIKEAEVIIVQRRIRIPITFFKRVPD